MEFITKTIPLQRGVTTSTSSSYSSAYSSNGTTVYKDYLELFGSTVAIKNGIILKPSSLGGVYGSVTGDNITYLINQSDSLTEGWIFQTTNSSGVTKNIAGLNNSGKLNVNEFEILNDSKSISLSINTDGNMLVSGSDMTDKPVIQSIIDGVYQDLLINPNGGNVSINTEYSEGYRLNVNGTIKSHNITVNGGTHNNVLSTDEIDGSFKLNGQPLGARIYKIDELLAGTFSSEDISNSVNAYVGKNLLNRVTAIETTGSQPAFNGVGLVRVNGSVISYDNSTYLTSTALNGYALTSSIPTNNNQLSNGAGYITGSDTRLTDARSASDVYTWAKQSTKPSYSWTEISSKPTVLSSFTNDLGNYGGWITGINSTQVVTALGYTPVNTTDGRLSDARNSNDVYTWAKQSTKPSYSYSEISSKPTNLSQFTNDLGNYGNWVPWGNVTVSATASSVVQRDSNGYIYGTYINSSRGDETTVAASYIFDSGDGWLRKKPLSYAKSELVTSASVINGLGFTPSAVGHTHDYATHRGEGTNFIDYSYGMYDAYRGGWRTSNDLYVAYAYSAGSASSASNSDTVDGVHIWKGSQASYNSIGKDANTMYIII